MPDESEGSIGIEAGTSASEPEGEQEVFAADMWPEPSDAEGDDQGAETPVATDGTPKPFDAGSVNLSRMEPEDVPEEFRTMFTAAQRQFKGLQSTLNERDQELGTLRNGAQPPQQQVQQQTEPEPTPMDPYPYLDLPPVGPDFSQQDRQEVIAGAHQVERIIEHRMAPYVDYLNGMPKIVGALVELVNRAQAGDTEDIASSKQDLVDLYGESAPDEPAVLALARVVENPATGEPFTFREAYERIHGITADQVRAMESKAAAAKARAKQSGSGTPRASAEIPASANGLTSEQVDANMRAAGWV